MFLFQNIIDNFNFLREDFLFFSINFFGIVSFFQHILITLFIFLLFYLVGEKIRPLFFKNYKKYHFFITIGLGYVIVGTSLAVLGFFSLFNVFTVISYLLIVFLLTFNSLRKKKLIISASLKSLRATFYKKEFIVWGVILFIVISFLRLLTPEIAEDGYHTDNAQLFINSQTIMIESRESLHTIPFPQLPEMIYTIPILFGDKEATRFIHFGFYFLIILFLFGFAKNKQYHFTKFIPLLFVTCPVVIRFSSTQYTDFFGLFTFLLAILLIEKNSTRSALFLSGIFFGAVLSAKVWMLVYLPVLILYIIILNKHLLIKRAFEKIIFFIVGVIIIASLWYIRAYLLSGNPIFPIVNTLFIAAQPYEINPIPYLTSGQYIGFNREMFSYQNLVGLSPLFFMGAVTMVFLGMKRLRMLIRIPLFIFFILLSLEQLIIHISWSRYLLLWFLISSIFISAGLLYFYKKHMIFRSLLVSLFFLLFSYYFLNTLMRLPYGLGWADTNAYLTRVLGRDNVSYYNFNNEFDEWITKKDLVGMYSLGSFYYAEFSYIDIGYILHGKGESFYMLKERGLTKLMIKGGDINWFCKELKLKDCDISKVTLLATYPKDLQKYNLYHLK